MTQIDKKENPNKQTTVKFTKQRRKTTNKQPNKIKTVSNINKKKQQEICKQKKQPKKPQKIRTNNKTAKNLMK